MSQESSLPKIKAIVKDHVELHDLSRFTGGVLFLELLKALGWEVPGVKTILEAADYLFERSK